MFLDEELLEICRKADASTSKGICDLNDKLCGKCEDYYKSKITSGMRKKDVKVILDRTFNLWDSFVRMALKEGGEMAIIGELFQDFSFKDQFLSNPKMKEIYENL